MQCEAMNKETLIKVLIGRGFVIKNDKVLTLYAVKEYDTMVGRKEATVTIFPANPRLVFPSYHSEGRNILEAHVFTIEADVEAILNECENMIDGSYARKLYVTNEKNIR
jgi:hypothetical protein